MAHPAFAHPMSRRSINIDLVLTFALTALAIVTDGWIAGIAAAVAALIGISVLVTLRMTLRSWR